jgi:hypothetical protein
VVKKINIKERRHRIKIRGRGKLIPLHAMEAHEVREGIAPTHS